MTNPQLIQRAVERGLVRMPEPVLVTARQPDPKRAAYMKRWREKRAHFCACGKPTDGRAMGEWVCARCKEADKLVDARNSNSVDAVYMREWRKRKLIVAKRRK